MTTQNVVGLHKTPNFPKQFLRFINLMNMECIHLILRRGFAELPDQLFSLLKQLLHLCVFHLSGTGIPWSDFRLQTGLLQRLSQWQSISSMKPGEQAAAVTSRGDGRGRQCDGEECGGSSG